MVYINPTKSQHFNIRIYSTLSANDYAKWYKTTTWKLLQLLSGGGTYTLLNDVVKSIGVSKLYPCNALFRKTLAWKRQRRLQSSQPITSYSIVEYV